MKNVFILLLSVFIYTNLMAQPENIVITDFGSPNEPSIFINSKDPANIMAGCNGDKIFLFQDTGRT